MRQDLKERFTEGQFKFMKGDIEGCIAIFTEILEADSQCSEAYHARAIAYLKSGNKDAAIEDIETAIQYDPNNCRLHYHKGSILVQVEAFDEAIKSLSEAIALSPNYVPAYTIRAKVYERIGNKDAAAEDMARAALLAKKASNMVDF